MWLCGYVCENLVELWRMGNSFMLKWKITCIFIFILILFYRILIISSSEIACMLVPRGTSCQSLQSEFDQKHIQSYFCCLRHSVSGLVIVARSIMFAVSRLWECEETDCINLHLVCLEFLMRHCLAMHCNL